MVQRIAIRVASFCLLGAGAAFCQSICPSSHVVQQSQASQLNSGNPPVDQRLYPGLSDGLPDAPSALVGSQTDASLGVRREGPWAANTELKSLAANSGLIADPATLPPPSRALVFRAAPPQKESGGFFRKYLDTSPFRPDYRYRASSKDSLLGRATDAASSIFVTRDEFGNRRLNTSYLVGVLTAVAVHSASRPYWARSNSMPLSDFGSTVGNDAGMNLMHEFGPGLRQAVAGHMPSFVFRIQKRIIRNTTTRESPSPRLR